MCPIFTRRIPFYSIKQELVYIVGVRISRKWFDIGIDVGTNSGAIEVVHTLRELIY